MVVFIDEVSLFCNDITHNDTLSKILKLVFVLLMRIIKNCHKIIVCQASINDNVFKLLNFRDDANKLFVMNEYKNYKGINAHLYNDENNFYQKLQSNVTENKYFLIASDSKSNVDNYYNLLYESATEENKQKFILITSETKIKIEDASTQFKDKFVFYSPSIIYGVDFNIEEVQDVFLILKGNTISPSESFQQITRTRKIKDVYIFSSAKEHKPIYNTIDDVKTYYNDVNILHNTFNEMCTIVDENNDYNIMENTFYELFINNEYSVDVINTNKSEHLKNILTDRGF